MKLKIISVIILSLLIMFGSCKSTPESVTNVAKEAHIITKNNSTTDNAIVYRYIIVEPRYNTLIQVKKVAWTGGGEPTYTVVLGIGNGNSLVAIDGEAYWNNSLKPEYEKQQLYEDSHVDFGGKHLFLSGIEIVFKDRYQLQELNLPGNPIYIDFNGGFVCMFTISHTLWNDALTYILYKENSP